MEINGVANLHLVVDEMFDKMREAGHDKEYHEELAKFKEQLDLLERYMIAYRDVLYGAQVESMVFGTGSKKVPFWHEIKSEPSKYPTQQEKLSK